MNKSDIIAAATTFLHGIRHADETTLYAVYQVIANRANDSEFAYTHEPWSGIAVAIQAEWKRRILAEAA